MQYFGFDRPSFGFKTYGFGVSGVKIQADFTTGTYKSNGATKTFADLFTFNRAGKAWLVKEGGLQEYAADVPRFDDGLLIEQSATNLIYSSDLPDVNLNRYNAVFANGMWQKQDIGQSARVNPLTAASAKKNHVISLDSSDGLFSVAYLSSQEVILTRVNGLSFGVLDTALDSRLTGVRWGANENTQKPKYIQVEVGVKPTSFIKTSIDNAVTRPADYLFNKITGTTVTGDWDSTLTLSIVNGQIVHNGYGRIRSLEIN